MPEISMTEKLTQIYEDKLQEVEKNLLEVGKAKDAARALGDLSENEEYSTAYAEEKSLEQEKSRIHGIIAAIPQIEPIAVELQVPECGIPALEKGSKWLLHPSLGQLPGDDEYGILDETSTIVGKIISALNIVYISDKEMRITQNKRIVVVGFPYSIEYKDKNNKVRKLNILGVDNIGN